MGQEFFPLHGTVKRRKGGISGDPQKKHDDPHNMRVFNAFPELGTRVTASASNVSLVWSQKMGCDMLTLLFKKVKIGNSRDMNNLRWSIEESLFHALKVAGLIPR